METTPNPEASAALEAAAAETVPEAKEAEAGAKTAEIEKEAPEKEAEEKKEAAIKDAVAKVDKEFAAAGEKAAMAEAKEAAEIKNAEAEGKAKPEKKGFMASWRAAQKDWFNKRYGLSKGEKCDNCGKSIGGGKVPGGFVTSLFKFIKFAAMTPLYLIGALYIAVENSIEKLNDLVNGKKH